MRIKSQENKYIQFITCFAFAPAAFSTTYSSYDTETHSKLTKLPSAHKIGGKKPIITPQPTAKCSHEHPEPTLNTIRTAKQFLPTVATTILIDRIINPIGERFASREYNPHPTKCQQHISKSQLEPNFSGQKCWLQPQDTWVPLWVSMVQTWGNALNHLLFHQILGSLAGWRWVHPTAQKVPILHDISVSAT